MIHKTKKYLVKNLRRNERRMKETKKAKKALRLISLTIFIILAIQALISQANTTKTITIDNSENFSTREPVKITSSDPLTEVAGENGYGTKEVTKEEAERVESHASSEVVRMIEEKFPEEPKIAVAIAKAESGLNPKAVGDKHIEFVRGDKTMGHSCGIFQVRVLPGRPDCETLKDVEKNLEFARKLYDKAGWFPWSAYKNQSYLKYL